MSALNKVNRGRLLAGRPLPLSVRACAWAAILAAFNHELVGTYTLAQIGSFNLSSVDFMVFAPAIAIGQLLVRRFRVRLDIPTVLVVCLGLIALLDVVRGFPSFGIQALMALRTSAPLPEYLFLAALLVRERFNYKPIVQAIVWGSAALSIFALARFVIGAQFLFFGDFTTVDQINDGGRALTSDGTMMLGGGVLLVAGQFVSSKGWTKTKTALDLAWRIPVLLYTHQASAVAASLVGLAAFLALSRGKERPFRIVVTTLALIIVAGFFVFSTSLPDLPAWAVGDVAQRAGNLATRHAAWAGLMQSYSDWPWLYQTIGPPSGLHHPIYAEIGNRSTEWLVSMHSAYYGTLDVSGAVGVLLYVSLVAILVIQGTWNAIHSKAEVNGYALAAAIVLSYFVFGYGYEVRGEQSLMMCLGYVLAVRKPRVFINLQDSVRSSLRRHADN